MVTLSDVITAWGGMSTTSTRRLTFTTRSTAGTRITIPGPLALSRARPSRKNTARSYSVTTMKIVGRRTATTTSTKMTTMRAALTPEVWPTPPFRARTGHSDRFVTGTTSISADEARRLFLRAQGLLGAPDRRAGVDGVLRRLGAVQLDTISVLA